jgi:endonuclease YncB( thermonuclease family)
MRLLVALLALALLTACSPKPESKPVRASIDTSRAPEIIVLQADALVIDGQHVRLVDVDAPQPIPHAHCAAEAAAARASRLRLEAMTHAARTVAIRPEGGRDEYNRAKAHLLIDGVDPAQTLISEGLAVPKTADAFDWCGPVSGDVSRARTLIQLSMF